MSISDTAEMYLLATLSNGDWTEWYKGEGNNGGLQPQLLSSPGIDGSSDWTRSNCTFDTNGNFYYSSGGWGYGEQTVTGLTVGETYHIITYSYSTSSNAKHYIRVTDGSTTHTSDTKDTWVLNHYKNRHGLTFKAENTSVTVRIYGTGGSTGSLRVYEAMMRKNDRWLALCTQAPNESGTHNSSYEVSGSGYARQPICFAWRWANGGDDDNATMANAEAIEFPECTGSWGTVTHIAVYSNEAYDPNADNYANDILFSMALDETKTVATGDIVRFEQFTISLEADPQA